MIVLSQAVLLGMKLDWIADQAREERFDMTDNDFCH